MDFITVLQILDSSVRLATPLIFAALAGLFSERAGIFDIGLEKILPIILKAKVKYLLIESSNPRHAHEWKIFDNLKVPQDKVIVPGVIDSTSNFVEHPELIVDRLKKFSSVIPKDQLMAGTDCGFSTFAGFGKIDEEICYKKLTSLVEGTAIASKII